MWDILSAYASHPAADKIFGNPPTNYWLPLWQGWWHVPRWRICASAGWGLSAYRSARKG
jgi:hypothetical protein